MSSIYKINDDLSNFDAVIGKYDAVLKDYEKDLRIDGNTHMQANVQQATFIGRYDQISDELSVMVDDFEMRKKVARAKAVKRIKQQSAQAHTEKVLEMMIDGDPAVITLSKCVLEIKERYMKSKSIVEAFRQRGYSLSNILAARRQEFHNEMIYLNNE